MGLPLALKVQPELHEIAKKVATPCHPHGQVPNGSHARALPVLGYGPHGYGPRSYGPLYSLQ